MLGARTQSKAKEGAAQDFTVSGGIKLGEEEEHKTTDAEASDPNGNVSWLCRRHRPGLTKTWANDRSNRHRNSHPSSLRRPL